MPELRKDPVIGRWVIIATERAKRPSDFTGQQKHVEETGDCPFCSGYEDKTPPEIFAVREPKTSPNRPGWSVRDVPSMFPLMQIEGNIDRQGRGLYDQMNGIGAHEIIIETPKHIANIADLEVKQIAAVFDVYIQRIKDLEQDERIKYVLLYKNYGVAAGGSPIRHCRTQLMALPVNPKRVKEELVGARRYYEYRERCIFCDMIRQECSTHTRVIERVDGFIAFTPYASRFPFEVWILPEDHGCDFHQLENTKGLARIMKLVMKKLSKALDDPPYNYILHTAPFRRMSSAGFWKTIDYDYHWHLEIMPRLTKIAGFEWGSGFYINPMSPEDAAKYLKDVEV